MTKLPRKLTRKKPTQRVVLTERDRLILEWVYRHRLAEPPDHCLIGNAITVIKTEKCEGFFKVSTWQELVQLKPFC